MRNSAERAPEPGEDRMASARALTPAAVEVLRRLVEIESPTGYPPAVLEVSELLADELRARGARVESIPAPGYGAHLRVDLGAGTGGPDDAAPLLVVGHLDTVHPVGTLERLPFRETEGRLYGPGVYDMKGSWAAVVGALDLLGPEVEDLPPLRLLITCDEEVGAPLSRELLEMEGRRARGALILEPPLAGGALKVRRKGTGTYRIRVVGRPAHAGVEPEKGASAIHELARTIRRLLEISDPAAGTTVNVGRIEGGTARNVVSERAHAEIDVRFWTAEEGRRIDAWLQDLRSSDPGCVIEVVGGVNRWAMEQGPASDELLSGVRREAESLGRTLGTGGTGGGSDGQLLAAVGCPVVDGLGIEGAGAHTLQEHLLVDDLPFRIALYSRLFTLI